MDFAPSQVHAKFRPDVPYEERWGLLKPHLARLYLEQNIKLREIVEIMKAQYGFYANEAQYKYKFKEWKWKKNISASKKQQMCDIAQTRAAMGKSSLVRYQGKEIDQKKLRRHAKEAARRSSTFNDTRGQEDVQGNMFFDSSIPLGNTVFLRWSIPYKAMRKSYTQSKGEMFPFQVSSPTRSEMSVSTPPASPRSSAQYRPSPSPQAVAKKAAIDRAYLFVMGRVNDLLDLMNYKEIEVLSIWLNHFWLFSFRTAKNWGRGPRNWTADTMGFKSHRGLLPMSKASVPQLTDFLFLTTQTERQFHSNDVVEIDHPTHSFDIKPTPLCYCCKHEPFDEEMETESLVSEHSDTDDPDDETTWREWPESWRKIAFDQKIVHGLGTNEFSNVSNNELPFSISHVAKAAEKASNEFLVEAIGFSIIAGNVCLTQELLEKAVAFSVDLSGLHPFHLATSYLHCSKSCCNLLDMVLHRLTRNSMPLRKHYTNALGHTVLDNLMISILKGHSAVSPGIVDLSIANEPYFVGQEVDMCGRWDADSECYRNLVGSGRCTIPFDWKHKFCHTSIQTICHCIESLAYHDCDFNTPSGLFIRYCSNCGQRLQLMPLHALVLTAIHLAQSGCEGEDLFGMLACLICLLSNGANPLLEADVSISALLDKEYPGFCDHTKMAPMGLAERAPADMVKKWSNEAQNGWRLFCRILHDSQHEWTSHEANQRRFDNDRKFGMSHTLHEDELQHFDPRCYLHLDGQRPAWCGRNKYLGDIWAAMQTELLTYRRVNERDPWLSEHFDIAALLMSLESGTGVYIPYVEKKMMNEHCRCGRFAYDMAVYDTEAAAYDFSNLSKCQQCTLIDVPRRMWFWK